MVRPLYDDGTVPGKELLEATQPPHFDCTILGKDQQRWHLLLRSSCLTIGRSASVVGRTDRCRDLAQSLLQISEVVVALCDTFEQVMRVATDCPVKIWSSIGLLLQVGKGLLWFFRNGLEHVLQEEVEVVAQETENGRTNQLDHGIDFSIALKRPGETRQDDHGTEPFGSASNNSQRDRPRHVVTEECYISQAESQDEPLEQPGIAGQGMLVARCG